VRSAEGVCVNSRAAREQGRGVLATLRGEWRWLEVSEHVGVTSSCHMRPRNFETASFQFSPVLQLVLWGTNCKSESQK